MYVSLAAFYFMNILWPFRERLLLVIMVLYYHLVDIFSFTITTFKMSFNLKK